MTAAAPSGVVTFLFTDVEGSTRRWEADADEMRDALAANDDALRTYAYDQIDQTRPGPGAALKQSSVMNLAARK
jgi:hypothetical protein